MPTYNIGNCLVEYERLPPNETIDKWIPLGVIKGEMHVQVTRRVPEMSKKSSLSQQSSSMPKVLRISGKVKDLVLARFSDLGQQGSFSHTINLKQRPVCLD